MCRVPQHVLFYVLKVALELKIAMNMEVELEGSIPHNLELDFDP